MPRCFYFASPKILNFRHENYHKGGLHRGIRSLVGKPTIAGTTNHPELYPRDYLPALPLKAFRGEPAITRFDKLFTPTHSSSDDIALSTSSDLHPDFSGLHPGHG